MTKIDENLLEMLREIGERVEETRPSDFEGWKRICEQLGTVNEKLPDGAESFREHLFLCEKGISAVSGKTADDPIALLEAVTGTISACLADLDRDDGVSDAAKHARETLLKALGEASLPSLHDAAALMVQIEPDDTGGLVRVMDMLEEGSGRAEYPEGSRIRMRAAADLLGKLTKGIPDTSGIDAVNRLIEEAMVELEAPENAPEEKKDPADSAGDALPRDADPDLLTEFITESNDLITSAEEALLSLETDPEDVEAVGTVFRAIHTIKGTSAFLNLTRITEIGHHAESLMSRVRDREICYSGGYADLALRSVDMLKDLVQSVQEALSGKPFLNPSGYDPLLKCLIRAETEGMEEFDLGHRPAPRIGDLLVAQGNIDREGVERASSAPGKKPIGMKILENKAAKVTDVAQAIRVQERIRGSGPVIQSSVRVNTERLDRLIDLVGELVVAHSMVAQDEIVVRSSHHELLKKVSHTNKIVRELQDLGMSMRMIPLKGTFQKMARLARDLARKMGKNVNFSTEGEDTEIDRNMVDVINDPLVHMVRNAVDHGIEPPEARAKTGKPAQGAVRLSAYHSAGNVVVEIKDDGKGLDRDLILSKAREKGIVADGGALSDRDVFNLIFEPGFSTAGKVTDVSGRGVGMDVVRRNIEVLRGQVEIQSEKGEGSVFRMRLPLTLAIIDGMVVRVGGERYVIPTVSIVRSIKPDPKDISTLFNRGEVIMLKGKLFPLLRLANLFNLKGNALARSLVVLVEEERGKIGLLIDELIGRQQIVIKTLGETMRDVPGISGGAIMPDGRVGLILDIGGLVRLANSRSDGVRESLRPERAAAPVTT